MAATPAGEPARHVRPPSQPRRSPAGRRVGAAGRGPRPRPEHRRRRAQDRRRRRPARLLAAALPAPALDICAGALPAPTLPACQAGPTRSSATSRRTTGPARPTGCPVRASSCGARRSRQLGGLDDGFFMYCEDIDLCRRLWDVGLPGCVRAERGRGARGRRIGASRRRLLPVLAASRVRYARKHRSPVFAGLERLGVALGALTHIVVSRGGREMRYGHARALLAGCFSVLAVRLGEPRELSGRKAVAAGGAPRLA